MNKIATKSCLYLSKAEWPNLIQIDLCIRYIIKGRIILVLKLVKI